MRVGLWAGAPPFVEVGGAADDERRRSQGWDHEDARLVDSRSGDGTGLASRCLAGGGMEASVANGLKQAFEHADGAGARGWQLEWLLGLAGIGLEVLGLGVSCSEGGGAAGPAEWPWLQQLCGAAALGHEPVVLVELGGAAGHTLDRLLGWATDAWAVPAALLAEMDWRSVAL